MRLFGLDIKIAGPSIRAEGTAFDARTQLAAIHAAAPNLPLVRYSTSEVDYPRTNILPPFGTNPPSRPIVDAPTDMDGRWIHNDPRDLWYLALPSKLTPNQVTQILRSAQGGDLWQQFQMCQLMLDTWPMLKKCDHEIREAVSSVKYVARPYCEEGKEPSPRAKEKADLVNRCFRSMKPDRFSDERGFSGMVYHVAGAFLMGLMLEELIWDKPNKNERLLRAGAFVHPRHFTFSNDGKLAVFDDNYNRLYFNLAKVGQAPDPRKFLCGQFYSSSGSTLGAGFVRPLAWYWSSVVFNREWMARMAQNYGSPFLDVTYKPGMTPQELTTLDNNIKAGLANRFIRHLEGTTLNVTPPQTLGTENPQRQLAENADKQCQLLLLGQTLTTDTPDNGGSRAQGEVHMTVRSDRMEGVAKWVAAEPLTQLAHSILLVNYGENGDDECPTVEADFSKPMPAMEQAQYLNIVSNVSLPLPAEQTYARIGVAMPEPGDKVLIRGQIGILGDTEQEMDPSPEQQGAEGEGDIQAKSIIASKPIATRLAALDRGQLQEIENLVTAAERAPRLNGQWQTIRKKLKV